MTTFPYIQPYSLLLCMLGVVEASASNYKKCTHFNICAMAFPVTQDWWQPQCSQGTILYTEDGVFMAEMPSCLFLCERKCSQFTMKMEGIRTRFSLSSFRDDGVQKRQCLVQKNHLHKCLRLPPLEGERKGEGLLRNLLSYRWWSFMLFCISG